MEVDSKAETRRFHLQGSRIKTCCGIEGNFVFSPGKEEFLLAEPGYFLSDLVLQITFFRYLFEQIILPIAHPPETG